MTEAQEAIELTYYRTISQLLQLQMALFSYSLQCTRSQEHTALERTARNLFQFILVLGNNSLSILRCLLDHLLILIQRINMTEHQAGQQHRRERTGHSQRLVIGLFRQQQQQDITFAIRLSPFACLLGKLTVLIASDIHVSYVLTNLVRQIHGCHTLRAVSRTGKTNQQQRTLFVQQVVCMRYDIGRSYRTYSTPHTAHYRTQRITDKCRCSRTRQHDIRVRSQILVHKRTNLSLLL